METTNSQQKNTWTGFLIGLGLVVIIIIIIIAIAKGSSNEKVEEDNKEKVVGIITQKMEPFATGPFEYKFKDIEWVFDISNEEGVGVPLTDVKLWLTDFSRHNGSMVNFEKPYKLGTYQGDCKEVMSLEFDAEKQGRPLAYAQCEYGEEVTDIAVFQDKNIISFKKRLQAPDETFALVYEVDMTEMVK